MATRWFAESDALDRAYGTNVRREGGDRHVTLLLSLLTASISPLLRPYDLLARLVGLWSDGLGWVGEQLGIAMLDYVFMHHAFLGGAHRGDGAAYRHVPRSPPARADR